MNIGLILIVIGAVAGAVYLVSRMRKGVVKSTQDGVNWRQQPVGGVPTSRETVQVTPLGITVYSKNGVSNESLEDTDRAYTHEKMVAEAQGNYKVFPEPRFIDIFVPLSCGLSPIQRVPSFKIRAGVDYDASEYDQHYTKKYDPPKTVTDHNGNERVLHSEPDDIAVIFAAEMILGLSTPGSYPQRDSFVVCEGVMYEGACNGFNHIFIAHNNGQWFEQTMGYGHMHPITYRASDALSGYYVMNKPHVFPVK